MNNVIILIGAIFISMGVVIIIKPKLFFDILLDNSDSLVFRITAIGAALLIGLIFIYSAGASRYSMFMLVIGWVAVLKGLALAVLGPKYFKKRIEWSLKILNPIAPIVGIIEVTFGVFVIYGIT